MALELKKRHFKQWVLNLRYVQDSEWLTSPKTYNCNCSLKNNTRTLGMLKNKSKERQASQQRVSFHLPVSMKPNSGRGDICEYLEILHESISGYSVLLFCFSNKALWIKAIWGERSVFQLILQCHGPSLREIRAGSQGGTDTEAMEGNGAYCIFRWSAQLAFFYSPDSFTWEWCHPQGVGLPMSIINQDNCSQTWLATGQSDLVNSLTELTSSQEILGYVKLTKKTTQHTR